MRAFVTGATGFLGQHLVRELLAHDYTVTALVRTFERAQSLPPGVRAVPGDLTRPDSFRAKLGGADVVLHCAALTRVGLPARDWPRLERSNVAGTRHILELAAALGIPRVVHVSTVEVYGDTRGELAVETRPLTGALATEYQRTKRQAHQEAVTRQADGQPIIIACPGALYGPGDTTALRQTLDRLRRRRQPMALGPDNARSWTYVEDAAVGLRLAAERGRPGATYHLAGPAHSFRDFYKTAAQVGGAPAPLLWWPSKLADFLAQGLTRLRPGLAERLRLLAGTTYLAHSGQAARELGWQARALAAGLPPTFQWLNQHGS